MWISAPFVHFSNRSPSITAHILGRILLGAEKQTNDRLKQVQIDLLWLHCRRFTPTARKRDSLRSASIKRQPNNQNQNQKTRKVHLPFDSGAFHDNTKHTA